MLNHKTGFTLIEVLIALIIFSFSMTTIYWGYSQGIKNSKKALNLIHEFNNVKNFYLLNKNSFFENENNIIKNDTFIIEKLPLSVIINDNFKLTSENVYIIRINEINENYEFKFIEEK